MKKRGKKRNRSKADTAAADGKSQPRKTKKRRVAAADGKSQPRKTKKASGGNERTLTATVGRKRSAKSAGAKSPPGKRRRKEKPRTGKSGKPQ